MKKYRKRKRLFTKVARKKVAVTTISSLSSPSDDPPTVDSNDSRETPEIFICFITHVPGHVCKPSDLMPEMCQSVLNGRFGEEEEEEETDKKTQPSNQVADTSSNSDIVIPTLFFCFEPVENITVHKCISYTLPCFSLNGLLDIGRKEVEEEYTLANSVRYPSSSSIQPFRPKFGCEHKDFNPDHICLPFIWNERYNTFIFYCETIFKNENIDRRDSFLAQLSNNIPKRDHGLKSLPTNVTKRSNPNREATATTTTPTTSTTTTTANVTLFTYFNTFKLNK